jgi:hypothetical protein
MYVFAFLRKMSRKLFAKINGNEENFRKDYYKKGKTCEAKESFCENILMAEYFGSIIENMYRYKKGEDAKNVIFFRTFNFRANRES